MAEGCHLSNHLTDFDNLHVIWRVSVQDVSFGGCGDIAPYLGYPNALKTPFWNGNRPFQAKHAKYSNFHTIKASATIPNKSCTMLKTYKYSSSVVTKCIPQIQDGRRPQSLKQEGLAVASIARDDPSILPGDDPFPRAHWTINSSVFTPTCTATAMRGKLGSEFEI